MIASDLTVRSEILIRASRSRVWHALTSAQEFAKWFGCELIGGSFAPGMRAELISRTDCSPGEPFYIVVERLEPEHTFTWRWAPGSRKPGEDLSGEGETEVEFRLEEAEDGTLVTMTESGFDRLSLARRARVIRENQHGWEVQLKSLGQYASQAA